MAGQAEQFYNAKDVEEAVQRGIQRGIGSFRNEDLRVPGVTSLSSSGGLNVSGVISRARDLLRSNIGSVSSSLQASVVQQPRRRRIGHQYTHKSVKQPEQKTLEISVVDFIAREEFVDENGIIPQVLPNYNLGKDDILFSGINARKQVCTPACKGGQKWDYPQVKAIAGQGKLYVRLLKPQATMGLEEPSTMNDHPSSIHVPEYEPQSLNECIVARMSAPTICSPQPSTSTACVSSSSINRGTLSNKGTELQSAAVNILTCQQTFDEDEQKDIDNLRTKFPDKDKSYLSEVRRNNITLNDTIDDILGMEALEVPCSFKDALVSHRLKYASEEEVNRINVDRESLWEDSIITFKSPKFDPRGTLRVKFSGEAGLDAGGLRMEYCSLLAKAIFSSEASLFEGSSDRYVPIYNASAIQSDIFGLVGKMMSYMIFHHDVPFRCISPAVYEYLVTGDLDKAARLSSVLDVPDWEIREVISKLNDIKTVEDLRTFLLENPNVRDVMNVAGWVKDITVTNKGYAAMNL
ncbi:uncharacterized protein, partial [Montipora capricornis]|uniref:uncharacterized protein n=1 Tax=Montipora capricornis TaxID=246305 RepID=UPI0035F20806